jgi:hypothetical protein
VNDRDSAEAEAPRSRGAALSQTKARRNPGSPDREPRLGVGTDLAVRGRFGFAPSPVIACFSLLHLSALR